VEQFLGGRLISGAVSNGHRSYGLPQDSEDVHLPQPGNIEKTLRFTADIDITSKTLRFATCRYNSAKEAKPGVIGA
jgi:hypothetical protein